MHQLKALLIIVNLVLTTAIYGQTQLEVEICGQVVKFDSSCEVNQGFQSVKNDQFAIMWLYLKENSTIQGSSISKDKNGEINYSSGYSQEQVRMNGFSIYPKKKDEVIHTPITCVVLDTIISGYKIELKGKKTSTYYLMLCGIINGKSIGIQVKLNENVIDNSNLPEQLKKLIIFEE